jgi:hypothetical protein
MPFKDKKLKDMTPDEKRAYFNEYKREYRERNREKMLMVGKLVYQRHAEKIKAKHKAEYLSRKDPWFQFSLISPDIMM